ncbi:Striatin Pro11 [Diplogelasinospora grovesii]|uniref:DNA repair protein RAD14 n=1 Tax=Diplogelasinospora grovesii TaxID=303347 RepID=A0AAN6NIR5_9PEZI|nr:Striatin Pro11 [Diplogelasinospora grovesii]
MERKTTPPPQTAATSTPLSPPTPAVTRRIEESRLRSKALRDQREAEQRAADIPSQPRTSSGFVATDDIQLAGAAGRKRPYTSISRAEVPSTNRDARTRPTKDAPQDGELRPARKFTKYVDYNFSAMTDTKGGFLSAEDDPWNKSMSGAVGAVGAAAGQSEGEQKPAHMTAAEWERLQLIKKLQRNKVGPYEPGLSVLSDEKSRKKCRECGSLEIDFVWEEVFHCAICSACKEKFPEKYSLLTKTECKEDYLLTEPELKDPELLPHLSRPNPHKSHWHDMMLFLRYQVEEYAFSQKWGSAEALDAEFEKREADKKKRKEAKFKEKLLDLKRKTRTDAFRRNTGKAGGGSSAGSRATRFGDTIGGGGKHIHDWGRTVENEEGLTVKTNPSKPEVLPPTTSHSTLEVTNLAAMGTNGGSGMGGGPGHEMGGAMGNGAGQPPATEYTLQGVMRFLQTEWHRHERDRNAWEIEKQEMKSRIASLEGQTRRADATQKALKKYVAILEKKVKDQAAQLKAGKPADSEADKPKVDRAAVLQEKLRPSTEKPHGLPTGIDGGVDANLADDEPARNELKTFLDQCQAEFTYLMITPANPVPPRESPPLPMLGDLHEGDAFGQPALNPAFQQQDMRPQQNHVRELLAAQAQSRPAPAPNHHAPPAPAPINNFGVKHSELLAAAAASVARSAHVEHPSVVYGNAAEWPPQVSVASRMAEDRAPDAGHQLRPLNRNEGAEEGAEKRGMTEADGWDFSEASFADAAAAGQSQQQLSSNRPDTDVFPSADTLTKSPNRAPVSHRRKSSSSMARRRSAEHELSLNALSQKAESGNFKLKFGLRGHLDTVRTVIFSGGGSPGEPEICTAGDDGMIKRFHIPDRHPGHLTSNGSDLDVIADFTHRGHNGAVLSLTSWSPAPNFSTGGRAQGDGWIFSGGQDATIRVWERGRVDPKATLDGHTDAVWALCVLPTNLGAVFGQSTAYGSPDRILLVSGAADGTVKIWAVSAPPQLTSPQPGSGRRGPGGRVRGNSMSSGSAFPSSPQPTTASNSPFHHTLVHTISRANSKASPTCITPLSPNGETFVVSYSDAAIIVYDTRSAEEIGSMASLETYDGTVATSVNAVVATTVGLDQPHQGLNEEDGGSGGGPTGGGRAMAGSGVEGVIISGHEDRFVRFFDANSGQCTYNMLAHPASISSLSLSPDGRELVSAGHDASLRFWSLEKRSCTQEITSHRVMRGEGVCAVVWSQDGRWVVSGGGDGVVKVFAR